MNVAVFWFRRDLRFEDNTALIRALEDSNPVFPLFIFDSNILSELAKNDARVSFIYHRIKGLNDQLKKYESSISVLKGNPLDIWKSLVQEQTITNVYFNKDYEPYAIHRDLTITNFLEAKGIKVHAYKDQVMYEEGDIVKDNKEPYTVFTPYKNKWLNKF
ncbi:MAG: deoxyribodipyrimidine photo-lyase, partial [Clostridiales bacterium]